VEISIRVPVPELLPRVFDLFVQGDRTLRTARWEVSASACPLPGNWLEMHGGKLAASARASDRIDLQLRLPLTERPANFSGSAAAHKPLPRRVLIADGQCRCGRLAAAVLDLDGHVTRAVYSARDALGRPLPSRRNLIVDHGLPR